AAVSGVTVATMVLLSKAPTKAHSRRGGCAPHAKRARLQNCSCPRSCQPPKVMRALRVRLSDSGGVESGYTVSDPIGPKNLAEYMNRLLDRARTRGRLAEWVEHHEVVEDAVVAHAGRANTRLSQFPGIGLALVPEDVILVHNDKRFRKICELFIICSERRRGNFGALFLVR